MFKHAVRTPANREAFATVNETEITNVELQVGAADLLDWESTAAVATSGNFNYVVKFPTTLDLSDEAVESCVKLCASLNCDTLVIHQPMFDKFGGKLAELAPELNIAVENSRLTKAALQNWANTSDKLTLDVEHFWKFTLEDASHETLISELANFLQQYGSKVQHVHLTGYQPDQPVHRPMYCNRETSFAVLGLLAEAGFGGLVVSEVSPEYHNRRDLVMDAQLFASWAEQASPVAV